MADLSPAQTVLALRLCEAVSAYILADGSETDESMAEASDALEKRLDEKDLPIAVPGDITALVDAHKRAVEAFFLRIYPEKERPAVKLQAAAQAILDAFTNLQRELDKQFTLASECMGREITLREEIKRLEGERDRLREAVKAIKIDASHLTRRVNGDPLTLANRILDKCEAAAPTPPKEET